MKVQNFKSLSTVSKAEWDSFHNGEFTFKYDFLHALENSHTENAEFRFILVSDDNYPTAAAVLSSFVLHLDLLSGDPVIFRKIKKVFPNTFNLKLACCGIPASFGQKPVSIKEHAKTNQVLKLVNDELEKFSIESKSSLLAWKEFDEISPILYAKNYHPFKSLPDCQLKNHFANYDDYKNQLRSNYYRKVMSQKQLHEKEVTVEEKPFTIDDVEDFYEGYQFVMKRTKQKLEVYAKKFFYELALKTKLKLELITISNQNQNISALVAEDDKSMNFLLVSKKLDKYSEPLYNWLIQAIVRMSLERKKHLLKLGQTSYYSKQTVGAQLVPLYIYLKHKNIFWHKVIDLIGSLLFPNIVYNELNVFKNIAELSPDIEPEVEINW